MEIVFWLFFTFPIIPPSTAIDTFIHYPQVIWFLNSMLGISQNMSFLHFINLSISQKGSSIVSLRNISILLEISDSEGVYISEQRGLARPSLVTSGSVARIDFFSRIQSISKISQISIPRQPQSQGMSFHEWVSKSVMR